MAIEFEAKVFVDIYSAASLLLYYGTLYYPVRIMLLTLDRYRIL